MCVVFDAAMTLPSGAVRVVGAVIERDGLILAARRGLGASQAGLWEFPGGKVEPGEDPETALRREIAEELGCEVAVGSPVTSTEHEYEHGVVILETYWCTLVSGVPTPAVHDDIRWVSPGELDALNWSPADLPTVAALRR